MAGPGSYPEFDRDIFGYPVDRRRGCRGRPRHFATPELRARVQALRKEGLTLPKIAVVIGITVPTLLLHYPTELGSRSQVWRRHAADVSTEEENDSGT